MRRRTCLFEVQYTNRGTLSISLSGRVITLAIAVLLTILTSGTAWAAGISVNSSGFPSTWTEGVRFDGILDASSNGSVVLPYQWSVVSVSPDDGLWTTSGAATRTFTISRNSGDLSVPDTYTFTIHVEDSKNPNPNTWDSTLVLVVNPSPVVSGSLLKTTWTAGVADTGFTNSSFSVTSGTSDMTWAIIAAQTGSNLPTGAVMHRTAADTGRTAHFDWVNPINAGSTPIVYRFRAEVTDGAGAKDTTNDLVLTINPSPVVSGSLLKTTWTAGVADTGFTNSSFSVTRGTSDMTWAIIAAQTGSNLPTGAVMHRTAADTGRTAHFDWVNPINAGSTPIVYRFRAEVTDGAGAKDTTNDLVLTINPSPVVSGSLLKTTWTAGVADTGFTNSSFSVTRGTSDMTWAIIAAQTGSNLPTGAVMHRTAADTGRTAHFDWVNPINAGSTPIVYRFRAEVTDGAGAKDTTNDLVLTINPAPVVAINKLTTPWTLGQIYTGIGLSRFTIGANEGIPPFSWNVERATGGPEPPGGFTIVPTTTNNGREAYIEWKNPPPGPEGIYRFKVTVTDGTGGASVKWSSPDTSLHINPLPEIAGDCPQAWTRGIPIIPSKYILQSGTGTPNLQSFTITDPDSLPANVQTQKVGDTLFISGTPSASATAKTYNFHIGMTDGSGATTTKLCSWAINRSPQIDPRTLPDSVFPFGMPFSQQIRADYGTPALRWSKVPGTNDSWITINPITGLLTGTSPSVETFATFTVVVRDSAGATDDRLCSLHVKQNAMVIIPQEPADTFFYGQPDTLTFIVMNGTPPYSWDTVVWDDASNPGVITSSSQDTFKLSTQSITEFGNEGFTVKASDNLYSAQVHYNLVCDGPPTINAPAKDTIDEGGTPATIAYSDPNGESALFELINVGNLPPNCTLNTDGSFSSTALFTAGGRRYPKDTTYKLTVRVKDAPHIALHPSMYYDLSYDITVKHKNRPPILTPENNIVHLSEGQSFSLQFSATELAGDSTKAFRFGYDSTITDLLGRDSTLPDGFSFNSNGLLSGSGLTNTGGTDSIIYVIRPYVFDDDTGTTAGNYHHPETTKTTFTMIISPDQVGPTWADLVTTGSGQCVLVEFLAKDLSDVDSVIVTWRYGNADTNDIHVDTMVRGNATPDGEFEKRWFSKCLALRNSVDSLGLDLRFRMVDGHVNHNSSYYPDSLSFVSEAPVIPAGRFKLRVDSLAHFNDTTWHLVSFPGIYSSMIIDNVFGAFFSKWQPTGSDQDRWRLVEYDGTDDGKVLRHNDEIATGKGYWFRQHGLGADTLTIPIVSPQTTDQPFSIPIENGWNIIGNPFMFNVQISDVSSGVSSFYSQKNGVGAAPGTGNWWNPPVTGTAIEGQVLRPWRGYVVRCDNPSGCIVYVDPHYEPPTASPDAGSVWSATLRVLSGSQSLGEIGIGVADSSSDGADGRDMYAMPMFAAAPRLSIESSERDRMVCDFRLNSDDVKVWVLDVAIGTVTDRISLDWQSQSSIDPGFVLVLRDAVENKVIDMTASSTYRLSNAVQFPQGRFRVYYGPSGRVEEMLASAVAAVPSTYRLYQNYPNPFNPSTTILYDLPKSAPVRLDIYNILGQLVRTLVDGELPAGSYSTVWNGRDSHDNSVGSGVYLARLTTSDFGKSLKMVLVK